MLHQTFLFLGELWQLFEVSQILEFLRYVQLNYIWYDRYCPKLKQRSEPWLTSEILELIKHREMFLYKLKKSTKIQSSIKPFVSIEIKYKGR